MWGCKVRHGMQWDMEGSEEKKMNTVLEEALVFRNVHRTTTSVCHMFVTFHIWHYYNV
jgi:hypothetical protein